MAWEAMPFLAYAEPHSIALVQRLQRSQVDLDTSFLDRLQETTIVVGGAAEVDCQIVVQREGTKSESGQFKSLKVRVDGERSLVVDAD